MTVDCINKNELCAKIKVMRGNWKHPRVHFDDKWEGMTGNQAHILKLWVFIYPLKMNSTKSFNHNTTVIDNQGVESLLVNHYVKGRHNEIYSEIELRLGWMDISEFKWTLSKKNGVCMSHFVIQIPDILAIYCSEQLRKLGRYTRMEPWHLEKNRKP